jgi:hypothetical protein
MYAFFFSDLDLAMSFMSPHLMPLSLKRKAIVSRHASLYRFANLGVVKQSYYSFPAFIFFAAMSFYTFNEICTTRLKHSRHLLTIYLFSIGVSDLFVLKHSISFKP